MNFKRFYVRTNGIIYVEFADELGILIVRKLLVVVNFHARFRFDHKSFSIFFLSNPQLKVGEVIIFKLHALQTQYGNRRHESGCWDSIR